MLLRQLKSMKHSCYLANLLLKSINTLINASCNEMCTQTTERPGEDNCTGKAIIRDVTKFEFEFDNVRTSNVFSRFEIRRMF